MAAALDRFLIRAIIALASLMIGVVGGFSLATFYPVKVAAQPEPEPQPKPEVEKPTPRPVFLTVEGDGFVPGEDVAVAVVTGHTDASGTGAARALIDPTQVSSDAAGGVVEVLLFGGVSGTTIIRRLP